MLSASFAAGPRTASRSSVQQGLARQPLPRVSLSASPRPAGTVPAALAGARVVEVDLGAMVSGTMYRGMFEERMKNVLRKAEGVDSKIILFIDEMHMLLGSGGSLVHQASTDACNMLKPVLARGRIRCVGATTLDEYSKYIEKDAALERRFQKVHIEEPSMDATIKILQGLKTRYQEHHRVEIQESTLVAAAHLAGRYITDRQFPDKAIDLIDEACATKINNREENTATMQTGSQVQEEAHKELSLVGPDDVARVSMFNSS